MWDHIKAVLMASPRDISTAILYTTCDSDDDDSKLYLHSSTGLRLAYTTAPKTIDLDFHSNRYGVGAFLRQARDSVAEFTLIDTDRADVVDGLLDQAGGQARGDSSRHIAIIPLSVLNIVKGYAILGMNPHRKLDADHCKFISDLSRQLRVLIASITTVDQARQGEKDLEKELAESERRIRRMAEMAPVGMYDLAADGSLLWANTHFWEMMGVEPDRREASLFAWTDYIIPEDQPTANKELTRAVVDKVEISDSLRLKRKWHPPNSSGDRYARDEPFWILYSAYPHIEADGTVSSLMGCTTDISHLKWAEKLQKSIAQTAEQERQRQEEFMDITSHEIRNPLSAITQCADSIAASWSHVANDPSSQALIELVKSNVESAESILFCAAHQKRIVDDVLTLSKIESALLMITPLSFQPHTLVSEAMQMFRAEFEINQIEVGITLHSDSTLQPDASVLGDSSRLMQVLVNLLTNAIKFTRTESKRCINITFGSTVQPPDANMFGSDFGWSVTEKLRRDLTQEAEYGPGQPLYLFYAIQDSGKGIPSDSAFKVFTKFQQADRRTHIKYGGSGLGLFISRELSEMHGGRIGVQSKEGEGSLFAFYVKVKADAAVPPVLSPAEVPPLIPLASSQEPSQSVSPIMGYQILLVEDNLLNQRILAKQLAKCGCHVLVANHGGEAVDYVLKQLGQPMEYATAFSQLPPARFDCILMDWIMPICDGLRATQRIREIEASSGLPGRSLIIGVTANARIHQITKAINAGMDTVVSKPFRVPELMTKIRELIASQQPRWPDVKDQ